MFVQTKHSNIILSNPVQDFSANRVKHTRYRNRLIQPFFFFKFQTVNSDDY